MKKLFLCIYVACCAHFAYSQSEPIVEIDNIAIVHEHRGWRVTSASTTPIHFKLVKGDLIVRIDGKNASETGPMAMASLFNEQDRREIDLFVERGDQRMETSLREIAGQDYVPVGANPFRHVSNGFSVPDAELNDIDGKSVTLEQFNGKWLLIDFMASWCPPCQTTLPTLLDVVHKHQLSLLMVAINDKEAALRQLRQRYGIDAPIVMTKLTSPLPIDFGIATNRWTGQVPGLVLIRPDGEIALIKLGICQEGCFEKTIESLMTEKAGEASK